ncbi:MAG: hypothetical protein QXX17_04970 [Conexivisphaerales archaeon]
MATRRRGQVLIMVGVVLSLLILSVALSIYATEVQYQEFERNQYNSAVLNLSDDFNRVLTGILSGATQLYNQSADITTPRASAMVNFTNWVAAVQNAYVLYGLQNNLNSTFFLTNASIGKSGLYTNDELVKMFWYSPNAISAVSAGYAFNLTGRGLYGVNSSQLIYLNTSVSTNPISAGTPYLPITITNNQNTSTPNSFQQLIIFNASAYAPYLSNDLGNIRFYSSYNNGAFSGPLYAWVESGNSKTSSQTIIWLSLNTPLSKGSSTTVYMVFLPVGTEYDGNYFGEAPTLSQIYGQFDNGPKVFQYYQNFNGTNLPNSITPQVPSGGTGSYNINNGLTISGSSTGNGYAFTVNSKASGIIELSRATSANMSDSVGWVKTGGSKQYSILNNTYLVSNTGYTYACSQQNSSYGYLIVNNGAQTYKVPCSYSSLPAQQGLGWNPPAPNLFAVSNLTLTTVVKGTTNKVSSYSPFFGAVSYSGSASTTISFVRIRSLPPNGVMPSVSTGPLSTTSGNSGTVITVLVSKEGGLPVDTLTAKNFAVDFFNPSTQTWQRAAIQQVTNIGGGNYTLSFTMPGGKPIPSPYYKYLIVWVTDNRGIMTESYTYTSIEYVLKENAVNQFYPTSNQSSEIYTLESISNGTVLWFGKPLKFSANASPAPIPIPPVKQLRVYTNTTGTFQLTPSQTEVWTANYSYPTLNFANWRTRFELGDKLVYFVSFANTYGKAVAVKITWLSDADAAPPQYQLNIQTSSGFVDINNGVYTLRLLNNVKLSLSIDYSISMIANGYHIESELSAVGWIESAGWEPYMLPGGDWNDSTATSFIIEGPVRAVAFRNTANDTIFNYDSSTHQFTETYNPTGPLKHTDIILVPYNVSYVELFETYKWDLWNSPSGIGSMLNLITLISGVSTPNMLPQDPTSRPTNWAYQNSASQVVSGPYRNPSSYPHGGFINSTKSMGLWFTQYNKTIGEAVIGGDGFNSTIKAINSSQAEFYIWNSYDGDRNAFWPAQVTPWSPSPMTIPSITESYSAALWVYKGFSGSNINLIPPNIYYRMFLSNYFPTIVFSNITT